MAGVVHKDGEGRPVLAIDADDPHRRVHRAVGDPFRVLPNHGHAAVRVHATPVVPDVGAPISGTDPRGLQVLGDLMDRGGDLFQGRVLPRGRAPAGIFVLN